MNAIKSARKFIEAKPEDPSAKILARLVLALESENSFELVELYKLDFDRFDLAIDILKEWRLDRYYAGKSKLFDLSLQLSELHVHRLHRGVRESLESSSIHLDLLGQLQRIATLAVNFTRLHPAPARGANSSATKARRERRSTPRGRGKAS